MSDQAMPDSLELEHTDIPGTDINVSRVALGTWAIGGWM
ncbi:aryl-alcohol dehydrogenase-like predicted oxidoreductase [Bradyrhizobium sp. GM0.4]